MITGLGTWAKLTLRIIKIFNWIKERINSKEWIIERIPSRGYNVCKGIRRNSISSVLLPKNRAQCKRKTGNSCICFLGLEVTIPRSSERQRRGS